MDRNRRIRSAILVVLAVAFLSAQSVAVAGLTGIARDASGKALPEVEILVLRDGSAETLFSAITDAKGWFQLPAVVPGLYRIVAVKPGYLATLSHVNTFLRSSLDLVLRPLPPAAENEAGRVPSDRAWTLRVPERSLLRDVETEALLAESRPVTAAASRSSLLPPVDGGFVQLVSVVDPSSNASSSRQAIQGTDTRMRLATTLGERGVIEVRGRRESLGAPVGPAEGTAQLNRQASNFWLDVKVDTDDDARLAMKAYFSTRAFRAEGGDFEAGPFGGGERQRAWGYDATWTKQVDAASQVALRVGYLDSQLEVPSGLVPDRAAANSLVSSRVGLENRSIDATGSYEALVASGHQIRVGGRIRMLDLGAPSIRAGTEEGLLGLQGMAGYNLALDAQDSWAIGSSLGAVYGMAVQQTLGNGSWSSTLVVPRAGGSWTLPWVTVRGLISYYRPLGAALDPSNGVNSKAFRPASRLGWEAGAETPLPGGLRIRGEHAYTPLQFEPWHVGGPAWMPDRVVFATDGNASDSHTTLTVERQSARAAAFVQWTEGGADGVLSQVALGDLPVTVLADRALEYRIGRLGARVVPSGTEFAVEYQRAEETLHGAQSEPSPAIVQEYVELQFSQHLVRFRRPGTSCRFLMAARTPIQEGDDPARTAEAERTRLLAALNRRVSAGLALAF